MEDAGDEGGREEEGAVMRFDEGEDVVRGRRGFPEGVCVIGPVVKDDAQEEGGGWTVG